MENNEIRNRNTFAAGKTVVKENGKRHKNSRPMPKASVRVLDAAYADRMPRVSTICIHGCCEGNEEKTGAYAAVILNEGKKTVLAISGGQMGATANRMYLMGLIEALKILTRAEGVQSVKVVTDEEFVSSGVRYRWWSRWNENGWKTKAGNPVKNQDLWRLVSRMMGEKKFKLWVPDNASMEPDFINRCDLYARAAMPKTPDGERTWQAM